MDSSTQYGEQITSSPPVLVVSRFTNASLQYRLVANTFSGPVLDGTPRDCVVNSCGAQADTSILRNEEMIKGLHGPLGWTQGNGDCKADAVISEFMGVTPKGTAPRYNGERKSTGAEDDIPGYLMQGSKREERRQEGLVGGFANGPIIGSLGAQVRI